MGERYRQTDRDTEREGVRGHTASNVPSLYSHNFISKYTDRKDTLTCCEYARKRRSDEAARGNGSKNVVVVNFTYPSIHHLVFMHLHNCHKQLQAKC